MRLSEIFEGIEGEGVRIGNLQLFIRLFGCRVKCRTCDSKYTWDTAKNRKGCFEKSAIQVFQEYVQPSSLKWISITGGDPLLQRTELADLLHLLQEDTKLVNIEVTGLEDAPEVFKLCDFISADIKTPNTGVQFDTTVTQTLYDIYKGKIQFKAVVSCLEDILFLRTHYLKTDIPIILTPCWEPKKKLQLDLETIKILLKEAPSWRMILQQHKIIAGPSIRGI